MIRTTRVWPITNHMPVSCVCVCVCVFASVRACVHHTMLNLLSGALRRFFQFINGVNTRTRAHTIVSTCNPYFQFHVGKHDGVPQESNLRPFLVYIKDINTNIRSFADDISLYIVFDHPDTACTVLNIALKTVYSWSQTWLISFNPVKSQSMLFWLVKTHLSNAGQSVETHWSD